MRERLESARVAHLATVGAGRTPHIVPITFALEGDTIYFAVDAKPKRSNNLQRVRNIAANPAVSVLVDHYDDDWASLWWVRADGTARVLAPGAATDRALAVLAARYSQYRQAPPPGPVVAITIDRMTGWEARANPAR